MHLMPVPLPPNVCPIPCAHSPMDCAPKAPTVDPGSMRLASYRLVHCSTKPRSSAAVTPTARGQGVGGGAAGVKSEWTGEAAATN